VAPRASSSASRLPILAAALAGVLLATVAAWYFFLRAPAAPRAVAATPRPVPTAPITTMPVVQATPAAPAAQATPTPLASTPSPAPARAAASTPAASASVRVPPPEAATPPRREATAPAPTTAPAAPQTHGTSAADAHALLARGSLPEAAHAFATSIAAGPRNRFSLQLLTACSPETVQKAAVGAAGRPDLFILPVSLQGRSCYRVCWGSYETRQAAEAGTASVPAYFRQGGVRPRLSPVSELLP
jgi:septal ring-binding cell division protein DamX